MNERTNRVEPALLLVAGGCGGYSLVLVLDPESREPTQPKAIVVRRLCDQVNTYEEKYLITNSTMG